MCNLTFARIRAARNLVTLQVKMKEKSILMLIANFSVRDAIFRQITQMRTLEICEHFARDRGEQKEIFFVLMQLYLVGNEFRIRYRGTNFLDSSRTPRRKKVTKKTREEVGDTEFLPEIQPCLRCPFQSSPRTLDLANRMMSIMFYYYFPLFINVYTH